MSRPGDLSHCKDQAGRRVVDRRACNAQRINIATRQIIEWHRGAHIGMPANLAGAGVQRVKGIVFCGDDYLSIDYQWLCIDGSIERLLPEACEALWIGRICHIASARRVRVVHGPIGVSRRRRCRAARRKCNWCDQHRLRRWDIPTATGEQQCDKDANPERDSAGCASITMYSQRSLSLRSEEHTSE